MDGDLRLADVLAGLAYIDDANIALPRALGLMRNVLSADFAYLINWGEEESAELMHCDPEIPAGKLETSTVLCREAIRENTPQFECDAGEGLRGQRSEAVLPIVLPGFKGAAAFVWNRGIGFGEKLAADLLAMLGYFRLTLKSSRYGADALRDSEERLRLALASGAQAMFDFDLRGDATSRNPYLSAACGLPLGTPVSWKAFLEAIHPDDVAIRNKAFEAACDPAGPGEYITEYRTIGIVDHVVRTVSVWAKVRMGGSPPRPVRMVGTLRDVSAIREEERQLLRANLDLRQFAYAAAHDLKEPLRNVSLCLSALAESAPSLTEQQRECLREAQSDAARMHRMVKDLVLYTNVSQARHDGSPTDATRCVKTALRNLDESIAASGAEIAVEDLPAVPLNEAHLVLLFESLISNAIKFAKPGQTPKIRIGALRTNSHWHFSVADKGIGFDPIYADRIFGVFKRLHTREAYAGNGIGLAICARIVHASGGQIFAEGKPDEGTTIHFTLPVRVESGMKKAAIQS
jgi:signal transduction histidine kinase